ncbi:putative Gonadotropin-releasing hormone receptor [Hypsibius exemplaris]|uniref:Gonadotropin-releasing hormone receptor n=1 Tax=Hypsibius exemplaris TaxID=2072580 RepID=A0A1W0WZM9_HYPEX|nr:putative Gonadotropin-releasing hormone receptor [Hypsibius exemplaris]
MTDQYLVNMTAANLIEDARETYSRQGQIYVLFFLASLAMIGNSCVIVQLCRKRLRERSFSNINFLILQLAISDLSVALFCLLADGIWKLTYHWHAGDFMCKGVKYLQMFSLYTSTYIIVTISLDRCIKIRFALTRFDHKRVVKTMSVCAWIMAGICSLPQPTLIVKGEEENRLSSSLGISISCISCNHTQAGPD